MSANYDPENYPRRNYVQPAHEKHVAFLLQLLSELERKSHPDGSAEGKDFAAFEALQYAGKLVQAVAGWAIDHQAGLAMKGLSFVPLQPSGTKQHSEYLAARAVVDSHEHEHAGGRFIQSPQRLDPLVARQLLLNLLRADPGGFPLGFAWQTVDALEGLEFGEPAPMFMPVDTDAKVSLHEMRLQLQAICFVKYRTARGFKKLAALSEVASALGVGESTLKGWEYRLQRGLGDLAVKRHISIAKNAASYARGPDADLARNADRRFGDTALKSLADRYKKLKREHKQQGK